MSTSTGPELLPDDDGIDWDTLLDFVHAQRVVPVVGSHLLRVEVDGRWRTLESILAQDLAKALGVVGVADESAAMPLSAVASQYMLRRNAQWGTIYSKLNAALERRAFTVPAPLRQLAEIRDLRVFLTTTFAALVPAALNDVRFGGRPETQTLGFAPNLPNVDISAKSLETSPACVYHLLGQASAMPWYAVTEEDLIEFLHSLQSEAKRPRQLFDYLGNRHLLFLGCGYGDWLARFFLRTLRNDRFLTTNPARNEIVVDPQVGKDPNLVVFLEQYKAQVFQSIDAVDFVAELHRRWLERYGAAAAPAPARQSHVREMPAEAVFLSYAGEDVDHVTALAAALEQAGVDVWLDKAKLDGGVAWDRVIQDNIRRCSLFLPFISKHTVAATEGYFRKEWGLAINRLPLMTGSTRPFLVPIVVDDTPAGAANIPLEFQARQSMRMATEGIPALVRQIRKLYREVRFPEHAP